MYDRVEINQFEGLNSEIAVTPKPDIGLARDINNLRIEKLGKLVSRDGFEFGAHITQMMGPTPVEDPIEFNLGAIALGELTLPGVPEDYANLGNACRFMVYYLRADHVVYETAETATFSTDAKQYNDYGDFVARGKEKEHLAHFVLVPLEGTYKDYAIRMPDVIGDLGNAEYRRRPYYREEFDSVNNEIVQSVKLYAPNKLSPATADYWLDQYAQLNQYRNKLIISDRINGDMLFYDKSELDTQETPENLGANFTIAPNCKEVFDVNAVRVDTRFGTGQENDDDAGVEQSMALYNYTLPKKMTKAIVNPCEDKLGDINTYGGDPTISGDTAYSISTKIENSAFITDRVELSGDPDRVIDMVTSINEENYYCFSTEKDSVEFDDIKAEVEFKEEKYIDPETNKTYTEKGANVYLWEDFKLKYFPSNGLERNAGFESYQFLKEIDKVFDKLIADLPRTVKFETKDKYGRRAPIGGWRYKFVWDLGDGNYSVPSTELLVPDILWSATKDGDLLDSLTDEYNRPYKLADTDFERTMETTKSPEELITDWDDRYPLFGYDYLSAGKFAIYKPSIYNPADSTLTGLGANYFKLKEKLYPQTQGHRFGVKTWVYDDATGIVYTDGTKTTPVTFGLTNDTNYGDFMTTMTLKVPEKKILLPTTVLENITMTRGGHFESYEILQDITSDIKIACGNAQIVIPTFPDILEARCVQSMFDVNGNIRSAIAPYRLLAMPLVLEPTYAYTNNGPVLITGSGRKQVRLFVYKFAYNFVNDEIVLQYAPDLEDDVTTLAQFPFSYYTGSGIDEDIWGATLIRGTADENDLMSYITATIESQVLDRLVLEGLYEEAVIKANSKPATDYDLHKNSNFVIDEGINGTYSISTLHRSPIADLNTVYDDGVGFTDLAEPIAGYDFNNSYDEDLYAAHLQKERTDQNYINNIDVYAYLPAQRFIGLEQLTSYFPSSALFKAPRIGFRIPYNKVPQDAKRLLIFRTLATLNNLYQPDNYGFVDEINIERYESGVTSGTVYDDSGNELTNYGSDQAYTPGYTTATGDAGLYGGLYYFDDVSDELLDFSHSPNDYDGLYFPLYSRFNININETMFYGNFIETYQPLHSREKVEDNVDYFLIKGDEGFDVSTDKTVDYVFVYEDEKGIRSRPSRPVSIFLDPDSALVYADDYGGGDRVSVVFSYIASPYASSIKYLNIYRGDVATCDEYDNNALYGIGDKCYLADANGTKRYFESKSAAHSGHNPYTAPAWWTELVTEYRLIKRIEMEPEMEGVFVDTNLTGLEILGNTDPVKVNYESGVRWSEPYQPNWLKPENFIEYGSGNGEQLTGLATLAGNLIVFKEGSFYRSAVQGEVPPISRTDIISSQVGCIAPNSIMTNGNLVYFLSNEGFKVYDNNAWTGFDKAYANDLMFILKSLPISEIRDITTGYNPVYNEVYLNIPMLNEGITTADTYPDIDTQNLLTGYFEHYIVGDNDALYHPDYYKAEGENNERTVSGHIYVHGVEKKYVTKFGYPSTVVVNEGTDEAPEIRILSLVAKGSQLVRLYKVDALGNMRSADILPRYYNIVTDQDMDNSAEEQLWAGIYIETPYSDDRKYKYEIDRANSLVRTSKTSGVYNSWDVILDKSSIFATGNVAGSFTFPQPRPVPIMNCFKTLFSDVQVSTMIKRLRKVLLNIYSHEQVVVMIKAFPYDSVFSGISDTTDSLNEKTVYDHSINVFTFKPTVDTVDLLTRAIVEGCKGNVLEMTIEDYIEDNGDDVDTIQDDLGKPITYSVEVYAGGRTQINGVVVHLRPIWRYLM